MHLSEDHGFGKKREMSCIVENFKTVHFIEVSHSKLSEDHGFGKKHEMSRIIGTNLLRQHEMSEISEITKLFILLRFPIVNYSRMMDSARNTFYSKILNILKDDNY